MYNFEKQAFSRGAASIFIASVNQVHIRFLEAQSFDSQAYIQLLKKAESFLNAELTSTENLARFQQQAFDWRNQLEEQDNLAFRIFDFCFNTLSHGVDCFLDAEINEFPLLFSQLEELNLEVQELGGDAKALKSYQSELFLELDEIVSTAIKAPIKPAYFSLIKHTDTSFFGMQD